MWREVALMWILTLRENSVQVKNFNTFDLFRCIREAIVTIIKDLLWNHFINWGGGAAEFHTFIYFCINSTKKYPHKRGVTILWNYITQNLYSTSTYPGQSVRGLLHSVSVQNLRNPPPIFHRFAREDNLLGQNGRQRTSKHLGILKREICMVDIKGRGNRPSLTGSCQSPSRATAPPCPTLPSPPLS